MKLRIIAEGMLLGNKWSSVKSNPLAHTAVMYNIPKQNISFRLELREK